MFRKIVVLVVLLLSWSGHSLADDIGEGSGFTHDDTWLFTTREILLSLYDSAKGLRWTVSSGWLHSDDICTWHGITCFGNQSTADLRRIGHVQKLDLSNNHLVGSIPTDLWSLPYIQAINLRDNPDLSVDFAKVNKAQYLKVLNIANTVVSSLQGIGKLSNNLRSLQVASLGLEGPLPAELFDLTNLEGFYANYNHFNGTLPTELGSLSQLTDLYLYYNDFTGQIPTEIGLLTALKVLTLAQNAFSGSLPTQLNKLSNLKILAVHRIQDQEKGYGISGKLPSFSELKSISQLYLENQALKGAIPSSFMASADPQAVIKVNLANNQLTGAVPTELTHLSRLQLFLANNKITAVSNDVCTNIDGWLGGAVGDLRSCSAFLCPPKTYAPDGRATATEACSSCTANKLFYGATTCSDAMTSAGNSLSERQILIELYNRMGGKKWQNSAGWLDLADDVCDWYGIDCNSNKSVTRISLKDNGLINSPPTELYELSNLENLIFSGNSIDFHFSGISQLTNLIYLDLSQTDLTSLNNLHELSETKINVLLLPSNLLQGTIPHDLFKLSTLEELDVSDNRFNGVVPNQVKQLSALSSLRCFGNSLSGQIPSEIGSLTALTELSCGDNQFTGTLPLQLNQLTKLATLSFRQSSTVAEIGGPLLSFANLAQLTELHLDSNRLNGPLPADFLQNNRRKSSRIEVTLSDNMLTGTIPSTWGNRFDRLFIDLSGNNITGIDPSLCGKQNWMDGQVDSFQCDAILCPENTFNKLGRQADAHSLCSNCSSSSQSNRLGSKTCGEVNLTSGDEYSLLEAFYYSVSGNMWNNSTGWLAGEDFCDSWFGISCDGDGHVLNISLSRNGLQGTVASSIFLLPFIREIDLGNNQISFPFNGIATASHLEVLKLESVGLNSIDGIGQATNLVELQLTDNDLTSLPSELFHLSNLRNLFLDYNQITGRLPSGISIMSNLEQLSLFRNRLTGQIPAAIGLLTNVKILALAGNDIGGTLPPELNKMASLEVISIERDVGVNFSQGAFQRDQTGISSVGIQGPLLSFNKLNYIKRIDLAGNSLTGSIPFDFVDGKVDKTEEIEVDLTSNQLTGQLPASLTQFAQLNLYVADNKITSIAEGLCRKTQWLNGEVGVLECDAILCSNDYYSVIGRAEQTTNTVCTACPSGTHSPFYGSFQCFNSSEEQTMTEFDILKDFYQATGGSEWTNNDDWLDPGTSLCAWYGVYCIDPNKESVAGIVLERNGLVGTIPTSIYKLSNLQELNFASNEVVLNFRGISGVPSLGFLNLDNTATSTLAGIENSSVVVLHAGGNDFKGKFPTEILSLSKLEALYMSDNNYDSQLPSQIGLMADLAFFECGRCGIKGTFPTWIGSLAKLQFLSLYQNSLTGSLPAELRNLTNMKHLDLSIQGLSGSLPDFAEMPQLTELFLSRNSFNGTIPSSFLKNLPNTSDPIILNLESNLLSGSIPVELDRFSNLTLYLSNNRISSIPPALCNLSWNEVDGCDGILCGIGSYNAYGRATKSLNCSSCADSTFFGSSFCGDGLKNESDILIKLFQDTNGFGWVDSNGWLEDLDFCGWSGITCQQGKIQRIILGNNNLIGTVSGFIWQLQYLEELDLKENNVSVSFDGIEKASSLRTLQLSETIVSSLVGIGSATSLAELFLSNCKLKGLIPDELFKLVKLEKLLLNFNELSGTIPTIIGEMLSLQELDLFSNLLNGEIPSQIASLESVRVLSLGENRFNGTIPFQINQMSNLEILSLQGHAGQHPRVMKVSDELSSTSFTPSKLYPFSNLPKLRELHLAFVHFEGTIPPDFLNETNVTQAVIVDLTSNLITGSIPTELGRFRNLSLYLAGNQISGISPDICNKTNWLEGDLALGCDALLCPPGTYNSYGRQVSPSAPCEVCTFGTAIWYGTMDCGFQQDSPNISAAEKRDAVFQLIFNATNGSEWKRKDNWFTNSTVCNWFGVRCSSTGDVIELNLASNSLRGTMPSAIYYLPSLQVLNLAGNDVDISFDHIEVAESLKELHLNSTSVSSFNGIGKGLRLEKVFVGRSKLAGNTIPDELYQLVQLQSVDLSYNSLVGTISTKLGNLSSLLNFDCQQNSLSGVIPSEIGLLTLLEKLDLSENLIEGLLSPSLNGMSSLQTLRVNSYTRNIAGITGPLLSFSSLAYLKEVSLASNSLTGSLPNDLLAGVERLSQNITVNLQSNQLTGTIPSDYAKFGTLDLELGGNLIEAIGSGLCDMSGWTNGDVGRFSCDGILCPKGTFNELGRRTQSLACLSCPDAGQPTFLGGMACNSFEKSNERNLLQIFFNATGGENWYVKDGWLDESKDYCEWFGISCSVDGLVTAIVLGGNNLLGTTPKELFQLSSLQDLWLYSNPIQFSFDGIEHSARLSSLLLEATGLASLDGIGSANALVNIDVGFNRLKGTLPSDLSKLRNLQTFSCSNNMLSGSVPSFSSNTRLSTLRLGNNMFSGNFPSFELHQNLTSIDVSGNLLAGEIPNSLLQAVAPSHRIFLDLSANSFNGTIPADLSRFSDLTIFLKDNQIDGVSPGLCSQSKWNDGDVEAFKCDGILCPPKTFALASGRASLQGTKCLSCSSALYFGTSSCTLHSGVARPRIRVASFLMLCVLMGVAFPL